MHAYFLILFNEMPGNDDHPSGMNTAGVYVKVSKHLKKGGGCPWKWLSLGQDEPRTSCHTRKQGSHHRLWEPASQRWTSEHHIIRTGID